MTSFKNPAGSFEPTRGTLLSVFNAIATGICVIEPGGRIILANPALSEMLGYCDEVGSFETYADIVHPEDWEITRNALDQIVDNKTFPCRFLGKNGQIIRASVNIILQRDSEGSPQYFFVLIQDMSRIKTLEGQLRQAQKAEAIGVLASGITHGFNNILSSILGNADFALRYELKENDPATYSVQQIVKASHRASFLAKQILTLSRQRKPELSVVSISPVVSEITKFLKATVPANIEIKLLQKAGNDVVMADPVAIYQVLMNLCTHGLDAMQGVGGTLEIRLEDEPPDQEELLEAAGRAEPGYIKLSVSDTGIGVSTEIGKQKFIPSASARQEVKTAAPGLSVVYDIVNDLEGDMFIESEPGKGSCISIILPVVDTDETAEQIYTGTVSGGKERILFVDDDEQIIEFMERALGVIGYQVTEKSSSLEAYQVFCDSPDQYDLIISDMNMNGLTGEQLAGKILAIRPDIPIIICTGYDQLLTRERALKQGIREIIMKPFTIDEMDVVIRRVLDTRC